MALNGLNGQMFGCGIGRIDSSHCGVKTSIRGAHFQIGKLDKVQCHPQRKEEGRRTISGRNKIVTLFWGMLVFRCLKDSYVEKDNS